MDEQILSSRSMDPFPKNFSPIFFKNQFRTKIELPTSKMFPDVVGKCAIITGSNTGLGFASAEQLLHLGVSHLIMGVRSIERGRAAAEELRRAHRNAEIEVWWLDMESYTSIQSFVSKVGDFHSRIDLVILNAGIAPLRFSIVPETGHEKAIQVNHLSTILLTLLLVPVLKSKSGGGEPPRITIVNSVTAHLCKFPNKDQRPLLSSFDNTDTSSWSAEERYGVSKLLCQLFIVKLADLVKPEDVVINMVDPGLTKVTNLARDTTGAFAMIVKVFLAVAGRPIDRGASTYLDAALRHGKEAHGCFLMNCKIAPLACWFYTYGKALSSVIWDETIQELGRAGFNGITSL